MIEKPDLVFAFEIRVDVIAGKLMEMGNTAKGLRKIVPLMGGTFEGPDIKGTILPGGYDWQLIRHDEVAEIEARYVLKTDNGALITIVNKGLRQGPPEIMQRIAMGEPVDQSAYYFKSIPIFETSSPEYDWLNRHVFIATGIRKVNEVLIRVWKVV